MQHNLNSTGVNNNIAEYFSRAKLPSQQETLGSVVVGILRSGQTLNRKAVCLRLMAHLIKPSLLKKISIFSSLSGCCSADKKLTAGWPDRLNQAGEQTQ